MAGVTLIKFLFVETAGKENISVWSDVVDFFRSGYSRFDKHLYIDDQGEYWAKLNTWETPVIQTEIAKDEVVGWLRNYDRKQWALSMRTV